MSNNLIMVDHGVTREQRAIRLGHAGAVLWLTGLSASGKSTLAMGLERRLFELGYSCYVLDGDNLRHGLNSDLGFSETDRGENIRRVGQVAALFADAGAVCITAFISPYRNGRLLARTAARDTSFHEILVSADVRTCEMRDPKGLYRKARMGQLDNFTGLDSPYEVPEFPDFVINTADEGVEDCVSKLATYVCQRVPMKMSPLIT